MQNISWKCNLGIWGPILSIALIAIRALSPNALSMEEWSIGSWILMLCPMLFPLYMFIAYFFLWVIGNFGLLLINISKAFRKR